MLDASLSTETWQVLTAAPIALLGGACAFLVRRRDARLVPALVAFAIGSALVGLVPITVLRDPTAAAADLRAVLVAVKFAAVFGLALLLGASGSASSRARSTRPSIGETRPAQRSGVAGPSRTPST